jgi:hypothetical protein
MKQLAAPQPLLETQKTTLEPSRLPSHCQACGAAVRPDEVEWVDEQIVECAYCGSPIR